MSCSPFVFPGHPTYVEAAAQQLGRPDAARGAGRLVAVAALANLCAQATRADPAHVATILAKAAEFRDQLAVALQAADAMLADVRAIQVADPEPEATDLDLDSPAVPDDAPVSSRKSSKGGRHDRLRDR